MLAGIAAIATALYQRVDWRRGRMPPDRGISRARKRRHASRSGERYEPTVVLTSAPNVPMAELICSDLHANGIEAFYKRSSNMREALSRSTSEFVPVEVWVGEHELVRAQAILAAQRRG